MKSKKTLKLLVGICLALMLVALLLPACAKEEAPAPGTPAPPPAAETYSWRITTTNSAGAYFNDGAQYFADAVEEMSGGRLTIEVHPGGSLYPVFDATKSVGNGVTEAASIWSSYLQGVNPLFLSAVDRPVDPIVKLEQARWFWGTYESLLQDAYRQQNVYGAGPMFAAGPMDIINSKVPIRGIEDFEGLKMRSSALILKVFEKLGASVVTLSWPEVYTAIQMGTVDAAEAGGYEDNWKLGLQEVTSYLIEPGLCIGVARSDFIINLDIYNGLPDDIKAIIRYGLDSSTLETWSHIMVNVSDYRQKYIDYGIEIMELPPEDVLEIQKIGMETEKEWCQANPETKQWLKLYHDALIKFGYPDQAKILEGGW